MEISFESWQASQTQVFASSEFCANTFQRLEAELNELAEQGDFLIDVEGGFSALDFNIETITEEADFRRAIRRWRNLHMCRIAWCDIAGWVDTATVLQVTSNLADAAVDIALDWEYQRLAKRHGIPLSADGKQQNMLVLGMGKLGGFELNFSSDIDLIYLYPENGKTHGKSNGERQISSQEFFTKLAQKLSGHLTAITADGFVFRVDTRLRPFGESGPLVMHYQQALDYYEQHGREWERYAMIKARACAGDVELGEQFLKELSPFIYRRYIDYTAIQGLRDMKRMIESQYASENLQANVKLGPGGIREVEFIAQLFQLVRGGQINALQGRALVPVLNALVENDILSAEDVEQLISDYYLLRRFENRLQQYRDEQTHRLPSNDESWQRLALSLQYENTSTAKAALENTRQRVHAKFATVFNDNDGNSNSVENSEHGEKIWQSILNCDGNIAAVIPKMEAAGFEADESLLRRLAVFATGKAYIEIADESRECVHCLIDQLIDLAAEYEQPNRALSRVLEVVEGIGIRISYLALLREHPLARKHLMELCDASPWVTHQLASHPILLDELLDERVLEQQAPTAELQNDLHQRLKNVDSDDLERQMEVLRQFKSAAMLRAAAADINHHLPLMMVSDRLTALAEVVLNKVVELASYEMQKRYGLPVYQLNGEAHTAELVIIGYGKLGGIELGYGSDLDIVFLHTSTGEKQYTSGEKSVDNSLYFSKVVQRAMLILQTIMPAGRLYEVDTRLRPNGASGLPIIGMESFAKYQHESAWTWEHQALVRARAVVGSELAVKQFEVIRQGILTEKRDVEKLPVEIIDMRQKMRDHLDDAKTGEFHIKQGDGGMVDIEFIVQFIALQYSAQQPEIIRFSDNVRIIEAAIAASILTAADGLALTNSYIGLRRMSHKQALQEQSAKVSVDEAEKYIGAVTLVWQQLLTSK